MVRPPMRKDISLARQILPFESIPLWLGIIIILPWTILTLAGIQKPFLEWLDVFMSSFSPDQLQTSISLPSIPLPIILVSIVGFIVSLALFIVLQSIYIDVWYTAADRKNLYIRNSLENRISNLTSWSIYRMVHILSPLVGMSVLSLVVLFIVINFFNVIAQLMGVNLELVMILGLFVGLNIGFFWFLALIYAFWGLITTVFGNIIAVTEAGLANDLIRKRSRRLAFLCIDTWGAYIVYLGLLFIVLAEGVFLFFHPDYIASGKAIALLVVEIINIMVFIFLGRTLTILYYKSLMIQYAKISMKKTLEGNVRNDNPTQNNDKFSITAI